MLVLDCCHGPVTKEFSDHAVGSCGSDRRGLLSGESHQAGLLWAPAIFGKILSLRDNKYTSNCFFKEPELYLPTKLPWAPLRPRPSAEQSVRCRSPRGPHASFSGYSLYLPAPSPQPHPHRCGKSRKPPSQESYLMNWLMPSCWRFDRGGERVGEGEEIRKGFELQTSSKGRIMLNIWKKPLDRQLRVWVRTWRNKNPRALLVGMENGAALWKTAWVP